MITILHGENTLASRNRFVLLKSEAQDADIISLEGKGLRLPTVEEALMTTSLFNQKRLVVIENLFSNLRTGKTKDEVVLFLSDPSLPSDVLIWEGKSVGPSLLKIKKIKQVVIESFDLPKTIFRFTDALTPGSTGEALYYFAETLKTTAVEVIFAMLIRQFRLMTALSLRSEIPELTKMNPWQKSKLSRQEKQYTSKRLIQLYKDLMIIDFQVKTGRTPFVLTKHIEQFIINLSSYDKV